jgi:hypothetical protein
LRQPEQKQPASQTPVLSDMYEYKFLSATALVGLAYLLAGIYRMRER